MKIKIEVAKVMDSITENERCNKLAKRLCSWGDYKNVFRG